MRELRMLLNGKFTSLAELPASTALLALAIVCWPTLAWAQTVREPQISGDQTLFSAPTEQAYSVAAIGTNVEAQVETVLQIADWVTRAMRKLTDLERRGNVEQLSPVALKQLGILEGIRFRVGMFVGYVTPNMRRLYELSLNTTTCTQEIQQAAEGVEKELEQLKGRAVFGRKAVADLKMKAGCPQG